ncbi:MAG: spore coat protein U domain-containing protein, partial [Myxococcales bacterium]|nr:spore coat protein U domain-containing protein [Myxococcales bacterium]
MFTPSLKVIRLPALLAALGAAALMAPPATAGTATDNLTVSATVSDNCSISTSAVAFGSYDPIVSHAAAALTGTGTVTITCTSGASAAITLGQGANAGGGSTDADPVRRMTDGSNFLSYTLYSDAGRTTEWGNTTETDVEATG